MPRGDRISALRVRWWWLVALALVVAALVVLLRSPTSRATATAVGTPVEAARTAVGLAGTTPVQTAVAVAGGIAPDDVADAVEVAASDAGIVTVVAHGASPEQARALAEAMTRALAEALIRVDAAGLRAATDPLDDQLRETGTTLLATPLGDPARALLEQRYAALTTEIAERTAAPAPRLLPDGDPVVTAERSPLAEALLAALAVLVLAVVATLAARGLGGERAARARRDRTLALARVDGPHAVVHPGDDVPAVLTRLYADVVRGRGPVLVLQLAGPRVRDLGRDLVEAARITGDVLPLRDLTPEVRLPPPDDRDAPAVHSLRRPRADEDALARIREVGVRAALVAVDTRRGPPTRLADAVSVLEGRAVEVRGVVVWRGRFPRPTTPS
ncbi:hypothetical protein EV188_11185 [Actinomycetospora succinea]|uniref:Uncharacterized protein n=1 Tax=Actinomycetospora succinea TaxID=663603 RepID=A0A4R6UU68_9PSEU|nr:hypothetical protein [Actinomycetospora succinea]TDQ48915.1 hypothetical protein EV188_11185 [Actinomycetospora succinea]